MLSFFVPRQTKMVIRSILSMHNFAKNTIHLLGRNGNNSQYAILSSLRFRAQVIRNSGFHTSSFSWSSKTLRNFRLLLHLYRVLRIFSMTGMSGRAWNALTMFCPVFQSLGRWWRGRVFQRQMMTARRPLWSDKPKFGVLRLRQVVVFSSQDGSWAVVCLRVP